MATDNPKVSGYVPQAVYDQVMTFKANRGHASVSQALTAILEEYFGLGKVDDTTRRLEELEGK